MPPIPTSCGVLVTDGVHLLLGHATGTPRWDIPKGLPEPGEPFRTAAVRELFEETGLHAAPEALHDLGVHAYLRAKHLALFHWHQAPMPDPATLRCTSMVDRPGRAPFPEFDRFILLPYEAALARVTANLAKVLRTVLPR